MYKRYDEVGIYRIYIKPRRKRQYHILHMLMILFSILYMLFNLLKVQIEIIPLFSQVPARYTFDIDDSMAIMNALMSDYIPNPKCVKCRIRPQSKIDTSTPRDVAMTTFIVQGSGTVMLAKNVRTFTKATFLIFTDDDGYNNIDNASKKYINNCGGLIVNVHSSDITDDFFFARYKTKINMYHSFIQRFYAHANRVAYFDSQDFLFQDIIFNEDEEYSSGLTLFPERNKLKMLHELEEIKQKTQDSGGIDPQIIGEKGVINGCCGAGVSPSVALLFDLVIKDLNHYHMITDQSMMAYYAYNDFIPDLKLHYDGMAMIDQTPLHTSVLGQIREKNETVVTRGKFKWLHHINHRQDTDVMLGFYRHCQRDDYNVKNYFNGLSDEELEAYDKKFGIFIHKSR